MSTNHTANYGLCQWEAGNRVLRTDFNTDNAKIDAAIKAVDSRVDGLSQSKADLSALESLAGSVNALSEAVSGQGTALAAKGNCQIHTASYTGNGTYGASKPCSLTFPGQPLLAVVIGGNGAPLIMVRPAAAAVQGGFGLNISWSGNSVRWYHQDSAGVQLNNLGTTYYAVALLAAN